ncbi:MAG: TIGR00296 family protein [Candidatus Thermoplasmatota archaeon]|nr:TIGR00296 family protein [Candidatus Thermoplasmatota archaeon]
MYSEKEGDLAVLAARKVVENYVRGEVQHDLDLPDGFEEKSGVFVTIDTFPARELRGCIGYPEPFFPLREALVKASQEATRDPRFPPLREAELDDIVIEVSLLTPPEEVIVRKPKEILKSIVIGRDGLIARKGVFRGLLLPQVAVDWEWDVEEFISHTCMKAGLKSEDWLKGDTRIYKFSAEIFGEKTPRGEIERRVLGGKDDH